PIAPSRIAGLPVTGRPDAAVRAAARRTTPDRLARLLVGDLDVIVDKALRLAPDDRYASAEEMAADVRRHIAGMPIVAHPESIVYRLRKFAARRPFVLPGVAALVLGLIGFAVTVAVQNRRIVRERDAAQVASATAQATERFLVGLLQSPDPRGLGATPDLTVVEALERGRSRIRAELSDQPEVRAALLVSMGQTFAGLGRTEMADTLLAEALQLRTELHGPYDSRTMAVLASIAQHLQVARRMLEADSAYQRELRTRTVAGPIDDTTRSRILAGMSNVLRAMEAGDTVLVLARGAVAVLESGGDTASAYHTGALSALAPAFRSAGAFDSAEAIYRILLSRQLKDATATPYSIAATYNNIGFLRRTRGDFAGAEEEYRTGLDWVLRVAPAGHPTAMMFASNLATVLERQGKVDDVIAVGQGRVEAAEQHWPQGSWRVGEARVGLGRLFLRLGRPAEAIPPLRAALDNYITELGPHHAWTSVAQGNLGIALWQADRRDEAARQLDRAIETMQRLSIGPDLDMQQRTDEIVSALRQSGNQVHADRFAAAAAAALEKVRSPGPTR
ncbi:MAG: tetratricopeptide repeat protein, partial [Gemmatimonadales bacterium]